MKTFEEFLQDRCPCHTNNSPEGFESWLADRDVQDIIDYAEDYGKTVFLDGKIEGIKQVGEIIKSPNE